MNRNFIENWRSVQIENDIAELTINCLTILFIVVKNYVITTNIVSNLGINILLYVSYGPRGVDMWFIISILVSLGVTFVVQILSILPIVKRNEKSINTIRGFDKEWFKIIFRINHLIFNNIAYFSCFNC